MPSGQLQALVHYLRRCAEKGRVPKVPDVELLGRFVAEGDEHAFASLVDRHGKLVRWVCRRVLRSDHDIDDAFQATFIVLARRASSIRKGSSIASWLYGVAFRIAMNAKKARMRRHKYEKMQSRCPPPQPFAEASHHEFQLILDEEILRLPEKYRAAFVLCCLEGKSKRTAALELGWKEGTVSGRLALARKRLQQRLTRRGITLASALSASELSLQVATSAVCPTLAAATSRVAGLCATRHPLANLVSAQVFTLAKGGLPSMFSMTTKLILVALMGFAIAGSWVRGQWKHMDAVVPKKVASNDSRQASPKPQNTKGPVQLPKKMVDLIPPSPDHVWIMRPRDGRGLSFSTAYVAPVGGPGEPGRSYGFNAIEVVDKDGGLAYTISYSAALECKPVAFDATGNRFELSRTHAGSALDMALARYYLDPKVLPANKVTKLGIEGPTPAVMKQAAENSKQTVARVKQKGIEIPFAGEVGKPCDFALDSLDGKQLRVADFKGKVVLVYCWANSLPLSIDMLPGINEAREKWSNLGLEVIGLSFDKEPKEVEKTCKSLGLTWPQAVPVDEKTRDLWQQVLLQDGYWPLQMFLIDTEGILRADNVLDAIELLNEYFGREPTR